ncbi:helix-turn-helix domain-containing protein [Streptomyces xylophagus]|uniref:helix-turn-helix domain-containing protein n=1 Tax=Streptomyces xylophagus TaxID=285514 RepID=UPI002277292F|nr:helix-turn-helix domain-containing protein [Streptomyces xylophagus]
MRAKIVLRCAEGGTNRPVAAELGIARATVNRRRARFIEDRLDGPADEPRPGRPPAILLDRVEEIVVATVPACRSPPSGAPETLYLDQDRRRDPQLARRLPRKDRPAGSAYQPSAASSSSRTCPRRGQGPRPA